MERAGRALLAPTSGWLQLEAEEPPADCDAASSKGDVIAALAARVVAVDTYTTSSIADPELHCEGEMRVVETSELPPLPPLPPRLL